MDWIAGGYLLTRRGPYGVASGDRPRGTAITLSPSQIDFFPDAWALSWVATSDEERRRVAAALDLPLDALPALVSEVTARFDRREFGWPNVLRSVDSARRMLELVPASSPWLLLGFAIPSEEVDAVVQRNAPPAQQPGYAPSGAGGVYEALLTRRPLDPGFVELGFDVVHIAHGQVQETHLDFDLSGANVDDADINADGLLSDFDTARRVAASPQRCRATATWPRLGNSSQRR